jgi:6-phosphogluconolactonase (cycloisomerase 2 family)
MSRLSKFRTLIATTTLFVVIAAFSQPAIAFAEESDSSELPADLLAAAGSSMFYQSQLVDEDALSSVDGLAISPDGQRLYTLSPFSSVISHFDRDGVSGVLSLQSQVRAGDEGVSGLRYPTELSLSQAGDFLYVAAYDDSGPMLSVFAVDPGTGQLSLINELGLSGYHGAMASSADGRYLFWAGWMNNGSDYDNVVVLFVHDPESGVLTLAHSLTVLEGHSTPISSIVSSPNGIHLYTDQGLIFEADTTLNSLRLLESEAGYLGTFAVFSPDGQYLYAADRVNSTINAWQRDLATGSLTWIASYIESPEASIGLEKVCGLGITPDGTQLFASSCAGNAIGHFLRSNSTGLLQPHAVHHQGQNAIEGLTNPVGLVVAPDGQHVYIAGRGDDALVHFSLVTMTEQIFLPIITN